MQKVMLWYADMFPALCSVSEDLVQRVVYLCAFSVCFAFLVSHCLFLPISLHFSPSCLRSRRKQPCLLCPRCSRCVAFPTFTVASWWVPSLHYAATKD